MKYNNVNFMSKYKNTESGTSITRKSMAKSNPSMVETQSQGRHKSGHNLPELKIIKQKKTRIALINDHLVKLNNEADNVHSVKKRAVEIRAYDNSNKVLEEETLDSKIKKKMINSNETLVQLSEAHTSKDVIPDMPSQIQGVIEHLQKETWFVSDNGSDVNNCKTVSTPCKNLQTVLDRASDHADIYICVTSDTLSLDLVNDNFWCKMPWWYEGQIT